MSNLKASIQELNLLTDEILKTVEPLSKEMIRQKPSSEAWSVMEIVCHVEEAVPYWLAELKGVIQAPGTEWGRGLQDEGRLSAVASADDRSIEDVLEGIRRNKQEAHQVLGSLSESDLSIEAPSRNPRFGTKPMSFVVDHLLVEHLDKHLGQIKRTIAQISALNNEEKEG
ncbi:DinB family protein [Brevibacillus ginsengisoli]|uniref:DinB family protein n=1 Tax=Brevibacillus ginsengisoli TaxID=363854 RepID=UPI003CF4CC57